MLDLDHLITPPVAFYFSLHFEPVSCILDQSFLEISGMDVEIETELISEGGENRYGHRIPLKSKHPNLVCKRVLSPLTCSVLSCWIEGIVNGDSSTVIVPYSLVIYMMNGYGVPMVAWALTGVYPVKWSFGALDSRKNEVATETMEFAYNTIRRLM